MKELKNNHTTGKWIIESERTKNEFGVYGIDISGDRYKRHTTIWDMEGLESENEANSILVSKAPELLENLHRILDRIEECDYQESFPSAYRRAKDLISLFTR